MSSSNALPDLDDCWSEAPAPAEQEALPLPPVPELRPAAVLRGTARGLEIVVWGKASVDAIVAAMAERLAEAPGFFRGSDARVQVEDGPLPAGCLARLDALAMEFELRIIEVGPAPRPKLTEEAVPQASAATGSAPSPASSSGEAAPPSSGRVAAVPAQLSMPIDGLAAIPVLTSNARVTSAPISQVPGHASGSVSIPIELDVEPAVERTRVVVGPVRSGVILDHPGHLIVFGDVNPGAEVRAEGNIVVLGRLRGTAHAGIGRDNAFILALRLEPQQLRIARQVARASEGDTPGIHPEIAHITGGGIIVERYEGRLPRSLADSI